MSRRAQVDIVVERASLKAPGAKRKVRMDLFEQLSKLGRVDSIERYVADPPGGPFKDGTYSSAQDVDWQRFTLIRLVGYVTPYADRRLA